MENNMIHTPLFISDESIRNSTEEERNLLEHSLYDMLTSDDYYIHIIVRSLPDCDTDDVLEASQLLFLIEEMQYHGYENNTQVRGNIVDLISYDTNSIYPLIVKALFDCVEGNPSDVDFIVASIFDEEDKHMYDCFQWSIQSTQHYQSIEFMKQSLHENYFKQGK